jgi:hypothetical protein
MTRSIAPEARLAARGGPGRRARVASELPSAAQRLRGSGTPGRGAHHGDRRVEVGTPARVDHDRASAGTRSQHARDLDAPEQQRTRRTAIGAWLPALGVERPIGHSDARQVEHGAEMEGESGGARVVAGGGIGEPHLRGFRRATAARPRAAGLRGGRAGPARRARRPRRRRPPSRRAPGFPASARPRPSRARPPAPGPPPRA